MREALIAKSPFRHKGLSVASSGAQNVLGRPNSTPSGKFPHVRFGFEGSEIAEQTADRVERVECGRPSSRFLKLAASRRQRFRGREFDYEAIAPVVLGIKERFHSGRELRLAVIAHDTCEGVEFSVADADLDLRLRLDVAHPVCSLTLGNNKVEVPPCSVKQISISRG